MSDNIQENQNNNEEPAILEAETKIETTPEIVAGKKSESRLKVALTNLIEAIREEKLLPFFQEISNKLRIKGENVDNTLTQKYGNRYQGLKQQLKTVNTRYAEEKSKVEAGSPTPVDRKQTEWNTKANEVGVSMAQKEAQIKNQISELWSKK